MKTLLEVLTLSKDYLLKRGLDSPRREAELLLADFLNMNRMDLYLDAGRPIEEEELNRFRKRLERRGKNEPGQYIHGQVQFYDLILKVNGDVLIPRPETEILVDKIVKELQSQNLKQKKLLDLCAGSGCIGLSLKKKFPELVVYLSDISNQALLIASENAKKNQIEASFFQGDLFEPFPLQTFDYIVCNPPYISQNEYDLLSPEVRDFEPKQALLGGPLGWEFYERLKNLLPQYLNAGGKSWFEIDSAQGPAILTLFSDPIWKSVCLEKDWSGHDRFISLEIE